MSDAAQGFGTVSFSVMATVSHQQGRKGISAHPRATPWPERRQLVLRYLAQRGFDFIGLKHCHLSRNSEHCALSYFEDGLNRDAARYGSLDAVVRPGPEHPEKGDTLSILYASDIWEVDQGRSGPVWHRTPPPAGQPGGHGNVFNFGAFRRIAPADGIRPDRLNIYNVRMRDKHTEALDLYRAFCLGEILAHMQENTDPATAVILLCDTNCKVPGSIADRLFLGQIASCPGLELRPVLTLQDSYLDLNPDAHGRVRTQHNYISPGSIKGTERNNRVLYHGALETTGAEISTWSENGSWPSYHYPVEGWFRTVAG